jgi:ribonuclease HI
MSVNKVIVYCDGACSGNQFSNNKGGWGAVLQYNDRHKEIYGGERNTTNQRMEIIACIKALEQISTSYNEVDVYSDSAYLVNCINKKWYENWQRNGWKNYKKQPVENKDLWVKLLQLLAHKKVTFTKVSGHSGVELNELADKLARKGISEV